MQKKGTGTIEIAPRISVDPKVRFGRPVVAGTRVPVTVILDELAAGTPIEEVVQEYDVTADDVRAVIRYASQVIAEEEIQVAGR